VTEREAVIWTSLNGGYLGALKVKNELILSAGYTTLERNKVNLVFRITKFNIKQELSQWQMPPKDANKYLNMFGIQYDNRHDGTNK